MTQAQIQVVLAELNSQFAVGAGVLYGEDLPLAMDEIAVVVLASNENLYPDDTMQLYFDGTDQVVRVLRGHYASGSFIVDNEDVVTCYEQVVAFMLAKRSTPKSAYKIAASI